VQTWDAEQKLGMLFVKKSELLKTSGWTIGRPMKIETGTETVDEKTARFPNNSGTVPKDCYYISVTRLAMHHSYSECRDVGRAVAVLGQ